MKTKKLFPLLFSLLLSAMAFAQRVPLNTSLEAKFNQSPQERIWTTLNNTVFFPSEYLYFNLYLMDEQTTKSSDLSTVAYIRLVDSKNNTAVIKRVTVEKGFAQGDLFIGAHLKTGSYTLQAYTQWMLNRPTTSYQQEIYIINPYTNAKVTANTSSNFNQSVDQRSSSTSLNFEVQLKDVYQQRDSIRIQIKPNKEAISKIPFSISVRKKEELPHPIRNQELQRVPTAIELSDSIWLPEHRGSSINAKITTDYFDTETALLTQAGSNGLIARLASENPSEIKIASLELNTDFPVLIQDKNKLQYDQLIRFQALPSPKIDPLVSTYIPLNEQHKKAVITRSVYNQIENNYFEFKPDSIPLKPNTTFFNTLQSVAFDLNQYTRFPTLKETFKEIIPEVTVNTIRGTDVVMIKQIRIMPRFEHALLMIDGIVFSNAQQLFEVPATLIDKITIYTEAFVLGGKTYAGAIFMEGNNPNAPYLKTGIRVPESYLSDSPKSYFNQQHHTSNTLPDYRTQLYWNPKFILDASKTILLYSSDVTGVFELRIQGINDDGIPLNFVKEFRVN